jgi:nitrogen fixation/metabolism regulation signal transduction histidine kinase
MTNEINVRSSGDGVGVEGKIVAQSGMPVKFHNFPDSYDLVVQSVAQDVVTATGQGNVEFKDYAFYANIKEADAVTYGWPTGTNCRPFGHPGQINFVDLP